MFTAGIGLGLSVRIMTNLLDLDGKDLEKEIEKIIEDDKSKSLFWTDKEIRILKMLQEGRVSHRKIAETLGRSVQAVDHQTHKLGFTRARSNARPTRQE